MTVPSGKRLRAIGLIVAIGAGVLAGVGPRPAAHKRESQVTWTTDVEPIVQRRCVGCHSDRGFAPTPLTTYAEARAAAKAIRDEVLERRMPPWPAARGFGDFINDRSLTPLEIELLTAWADGGAPLGPAIAGGQRANAAAPAPPPDLLLMMPAAVSVTALTMRYDLPTRLTADRWITGWEYRPGNRPLIEQAVLWIAPTTLLDHWTPSDRRVIYRPGMGQRIPRGSHVTLEVHYRKSTTREMDRSGVALYFGDGPAHQVRHRSLACGATTIDHGVEVLSVTPRTASAGDSIEVVARDPDGGRRALVVVPRYLPEYPITYRLRSPMRHRPGAVVELRSSAAACTADLQYVRR
jgi:hypothetical protein